jgi:hypothetical protein
MENQECLSLVFNKLCNFDLLVQLTNKIHTIKKQQNNFNTSKDLETFLLPKLAKNKNLISFLHNKKHYTVNNEKDLIYLKKQVKNKKIF